MKPITKLFFFFSFLSFMISSCENEPSLVFPGVKAKTASHLGEGVWLNISTDYSKAKSYDGFQARKYESSISLQVDYASVSDVIKSFDKKLLARKRTKLLKLETVKFGEKDTAVYAIVHDKRKQTIRYLLSIKKENKMYGVKAFCQERYREKYDPIIKWSLQSVAFGEEVEKKVPFVLWELNSLTDYKLTRDGKDPSESEDEALITVKVIDKKQAGHSRDDRIEILKEEIKKYSSKTAYNTKVERVGSGHFLTIKIYDGENSVVGVYLSDGEEINSLFIGTANNRKAIDEIESYIRKENIKTVLDVR